MNKHLHLILPALFLFQSVFGQTGDLRITLDASLGAKELAGSDHVFLSAAAITNGTEGENYRSVRITNQNGTLVMMHPAGKNKWTLCFDPINYFGFRSEGNVTDDPGIQAMELTFSNGAGKTMNNQSDGSPIIINLTKETPVSSFPGLTISDCLVGVPDTKIKEFVLNNFPNPVKTSTQFAFHLKESASVVSITVFDMIGQQVRKFTLSDVGPGVTKINWNGDSEKGGALKNGLYFYTLEVDGAKLMSKRMVISR